MTVQTSATNVYAMEIDVIGKPIIVTTNSDPEGSWITAAYMRRHITATPLRSGLNSSIKELRL